MKSILVILSIIGYSHILNAQESLYILKKNDCVFQMEASKNSITNEKVSGSCNHTSNYWNNDNLYIPNEDNNVIYMKLNFIFLTKLDGTGNFEQNNPEHIQVIDDIIDRFNMRLSTIIDTNNSSCYSGNDFLNNTKIQVVVNKIWRVDPAWDFLETGYNPNNGPLGGNQVLYPPSLNYHYSYFDDDITIPKGVDIVFANNGDIYEDLVVNQNYENYEDGFTGEGWAASQFPTTLDLTRASRQFYPDYFNKYIYMKEVVPEVYGQPWSVVRNWYISVGNKTFAHELGHTLWLYHQNQCPVSLMNASWSSPQNYLKPPEIGKMWRAASITNVRQFFTENSYANNKISIASDENWDLDIRVYSDIEIDSDITLKTTCNLIVPAQNRIIVKDGSNFIIEGSTLNSANNSSWEGIKVEGTGAFIIFPDTQINSNYFYVYTDNSPIAKSTNNKQLKLNSNNNIDSYDNILLFNTNDKNNIHIYPNPFKEVIHIDFNKINETATKVKIINNLGVTIFDSILEPSANTINLINLKIGVYYLIIENEDNILNQIIVKN